MKKRIDEIMDHPATQTDKHSRVVRREKRRVRVSSLNLKPSRTDESQADAANINTIVNRMNKGNYIPPLRGPGEYRDAVLEATDLQTAHLMIEEGSSIFDTLPALTREHFNNNPMELHEFLMDPQVDIEKGIELGIFKKTGLPDVVGQPEPKATPAVVPKTEQNTEPKS